MTLSRVSLELVVNLSQMSQTGIPPTIVKRLHLIQSLAKRNLHVHARAPSTPSMAIRSSFRTLLQRRSQTTMSTNLRVTVTAAASRTTTKPSQCSGRTCRQSAACFESRAMTSTSSVLWPSVMYSYSALVYSYSVLLYYTVLLVVLCFCFEPTSHAVYPSNWWTTAVFKLERWFL